MKTISIIHCCVVLIALQFLSGCNKTSIPDRPNIVFIMTDDHSIQTLSAYDDRFIATPNIDRLAENGIIFANSFVSNSICAPSRAVMLTGKHSHLNGQIDNVVTFDGSQQTFPKLLQANGYQTALVGKWHLRSDPTGFDYWSVLPGQGQYYNPDFNEMGENKRVEGYATTVTTDIALDWMETRRDPSKPFCLLLHHKAPHRTWMPDTAYLELFADKEFDLPSNFFDQYEGRQAAAEQHMSIRTEDMDVVYDLKMADPEEEISTRLSNAGRGNLKRMNEAQLAAWEKHYLPIIQKFKTDALTGEELAIWKYQRYMRDYLRCIVSVDENVGRVLDFLDNSGLAENTVVVYTSDQGFYMGEHGWFDKRFMYEQSLRTPLLIQPPKGKDQGRKVSALVQNIDYAPTFLDLAGVPVPADMQGMSLKPYIMDAPEPQWRDAIYYHYYEYPNEHMVKRHYGVRTDRYKLIHFYFDIDTWELYDLETDPDEMQNLIDDPDYDDVEIELRARLAALQEQYGDSSFENPQ